MTNKMTAFSLFLALLLSLVPMAGASTSSGLAASLDGIPSDVEPTGDHALASTVGGRNWSCVGTVLGFSLAALAVGAATGGVGIAIAGAYAPIVIAFACA